MVRFQLGRATEEPEIEPGLESWLDLFWELCTDRQVSMAPMPIPASAIDRYAFGMASEEAVMFRACIRAMDREWLDAAQKKAKAKDDKDEIEIIRADPETAAQSVRGMLRRGASVSPS